MKTKRTAEIRENDSKRAVIVLILGLLWILLTLIFGSMILSAFNPQGFEFTVINRYLYGSLYIPGALAIGYSSAVMSKSKGLIFIAQMTIVTIISVVCLTYAGIILPFIIGF